MWRSSVLVVRLLGQYCDEAESNVIFQQLYKEDEDRRPRLDDLPFRQLKAESKEGLEVPFT